MVLHREAPPWGKVLEEGVLQGFIGLCKGWVETRIYSNWTAQHMARAEAVKERIFFSCPQELGGEGGED